MATLAYRVQFLDDTDPFNSTNFPEPSRPPLFTFREDLALGTQLAGVHRLLRAPHKVRHGGVGREQRTQPLQPRLSGWGRCRRAGLVEAPGTRAQGQMPMRVRQRGREYPEAGAQLCSDWREEQPLRPSADLWARGASRCHAGRRQDALGSPWPLR